MNNNDTSNVNEITENKDKLVFTGNFVFYKSMLDSVDELPKEKGMELLYAIVTYGVKGEIITEDRYLLAILKSIIPNIDNSNKRFRKRLEYQNNKAIEKYAKKFNDEKKMYDARVAAIRASNECAKYTSKNKTSAEDKNNNGCINPNYDSTNPNRPGNDPNKPYGGSIR